MKKYSYLIFVALPFMFSIVNGQANYIKEYKPMVDSLSAMYQIPSSVIFGVAILESGGGVSVVGRRLNNHFGLKGRVAGGDTVSIKSSYRYFARPVDSYVFFCNLLVKRKFYPALKGNNDYKKWVTAISKTGYAANAAVWSKHVIDIIRKSNLDK